MSHFWVLSSNISFKMTSTYVKWQHYTIYFDLHICITFGMYELRMCQRMEEEVYMYTWTGCFLGVNIILNPQITTFVMRAHFPFYVSNSLSFNFISIISVIWREWAIFSDHHYWEPISTCLFPEESVCNMTLPTIWHRIWQ